MTAYISYDPTVIIVKNSFNKPPLQHKRIPTTIETASTKKHDTPNMSSLNYPLLAIPAYYVFSILPHVYAQSVLTGAGYKPNNANPRSTAENAKGKVPDAVYALLPFPLP
jgi:hypothetical protein